MKKRRDILTSYGFIALSMFALVKPDSLEYLGLGFLDMLLMIYDILLMLILIINIKNYRVSKQSVLIFGMYFTMLISTVVHSGSYLYLIKTIGPAIVMCFLTDYFMQRVPMKFFLTNSIMWGILFFCNLISIILFPNGMYSTERIMSGNYLLGFDNGFTLTLIPCIGYTLLYSFLKYNKKFSLFSIFLILILVITELLRWSASGIVMSASLIIVLAADNTTWIKKIVRPRLMIGTFYVFTYLVVFQRILNVFAPIIVDVLNKDMTLTGRTYLWDYAIEVFKKNWFIGVGQGGFTVVGKYNTYLHPHCLILDILYKGGIVMFGFFIAAMHRFVNYTSKYIDSYSARIILMVVICILIGEIVNSAQYKPYLWSYIVMAAYLPQLTENKGLYKKEFIKIK